MASTSMMIRSISSLLITGIKFNLVVSARSKISLPASRKRVNTVNVNSMVSTINVNAMMGSLVPHAINVSLRSIRTFERSWRKNNDCCSDDRGDCSTSDGFVWSDCWNCLLHWSVDQMHQQSTSTNDEVLGFLSIGGQWDAVIVLCACRTQASILSDDMFQWFHLSSIAGLL